MWDGCVWMLMWGGCGWMLMWGGCGWMLMWGGGRWMLMWGGCLDADVGGCVWQQVQPVGQAGPPGEESGPPARDQRRAKQAGAGAGGGVGQRQQDEKNPRHPAGIGRVFHMPDSKVLESFQYQAPVVWNSLPFLIPMTFCKAQFNTHPFLVAFLW